MSPCEGAFSTPVLGPRDPWRWRPGLRACLHRGNDASSVTGSGWAPGPVQAWDRLSPQGRPGSNGGGGDTDGPGAGEWRAPRGPPTEEREMSLDSSPPLLLLLGIIVTPIPRSYFLARGYVKRLFLESSGSRCGRLFSGIGTGICTLLEMRRSWECSRKCKSPL